MSTKIYFRLINLLTFCYILLNSQKSSVSFYIRKKGSPILVNLFPIVLYFKTYFYFTRATVSLQIASSSFVGITATLTLESGVEITVSSPRFLFASVSMEIPRYLK